MSNNLQVTPFDSDEKYNEIIALPSTEPIVLGDVLKKMGMRGTPIAARDLVDTTFDVLRARQFKSDKKAGNKPYFCIVRPVGSDELFQTILGGGAIVEAIDMFCSLNIENPVRFTLRWKSKGKDEGYYFFE